MDTQLRAQAHEVMQKFAEVPLAFRLKYLRRLGLNDKEVCEILDEAGSEGGKATEPTELMDTVAT